MKKTLCVMLLLVYVLLEGQTVRTARHVVLDIDGGVDDARVCASLLSCPDTEVMCITTTHGILHAEDAASKVCKMLSHLHHEGIPVASGRDTTFDASWVNAVCHTAYWGRDEDTLRCEPCGLSPEDLMARAVLHSPMKAIIVACGPLSNIARFISRYPNASLRIGEILWSSSMDKSDYNLTADTAAYHAVMQSGIPLRVVCEGECRVSENDICHMYKNIDTPASRLLQGNAHSIYPHKPPFADLTTVLYLYYPHMFHSETKDNVTYSIIAPHVKKREIIEALRNVTTGAFYKESQMFNCTLDRENMFYDDVKSIKDSVISRYGHSEWRAFLIAGELHGHLGVYAVIGVKMGQRVREYMGIGIDDVNITSYTEPYPPYSCMNDGLQVSTGGTLGHALISLAGGDSISYSPSARFTYGAKDIIVSLKPSLKKEIDARIMDVVINYGIGTVQYWEKIRELALEYMAKWDRKEIFEIKSLSKELI